jgi:hypothetical protein
MIIDVVQIVIIPLLHQTAEARVVVLILNHLEAHPEVHPAAGVVPAVVQAEAVGVAEILDDKIIKNYL